MTQLTLEELYYGNICPAETTFNKYSDYGRCFTKIGELNAEVCSQLTDEYKNKIDEIESIYTRILAITEREYYLAGFRLGAKMMNEIYNGRSTTFRET